jgi:hypothetical protein
MIILCPNPIVFTIRSKKGREVVQVLEVSSIEDKRRVSMSNSLARAAQGMSLSEKRIVALALSSQNTKSLSKLAESTTPAGWKVKLRAMDYAETFGIDPNTAYDQLKTASERLLDRLVTWEDKAPNGKNRVNKLRWISFARYTQGDGVI